VLIRVGVCNVMLGLDFEILFYACSWETFMTFLGRCRGFSSSNRGGYTFLYRKFLCCRLLHEMSKQQREGIWGSGLGRFWEMLS
jgi:hypothetical protein